MYTQHTPRSKTSNTELTALLPGVVNRPQVQIVSQLEVREVTDRLDRVGEVPVWSQKLCWYYVHVPSYSRDAHAVVSHGSDGSSNVRSSPSREREMNTRRGKEEEKRTRQKRCEKSAILERE